jgi:hypothetical protein
VTYTWEAVLCVEDYDGDFEECATATDDAADQFRMEVRLAERTDVVLQSVEFVEFDSPNPSHACGYFYCTYEADQPLAEETD